jgi:hypothetical protein
LNVDRKEPCVSSRGFFFAPIGVFEIGEDARCD